MRRPPVQPHLSRRNHRRPQIRSPRRRRRIDVTKNVGVVVVVVQPATLQQVSTSLKRFFSSLRFVPGNKLDRLSPKIPFLDQSDVCR
jgi:hypothetical protein